MRIKCIFYGPTSNMFETHTTDGQPATTTTTTTSAAAVATTTMTIGKKAIPFHMEICNVHSSSRVHLLGMLVCYDYVARI
jgi:hypothetical protein